MNLFSNKLFQLFYVMLFCGSFSFLDAQNNQSLYIDFDNCTAYSNGSNADYSEFAGEMSVPDCGDCPTLNLLGGSLYRENPFTNRHSCTPGVDGGEALCISSLDECTFEEDHSLALRFDLEIMPPSNGAVTFESISFQSKSPEQFDWIDGMSGMNNYPTKYGIRILVDNQEVFRETEIPTNVDWAMQEFQFTGFPGFDINSTTIFSVEILPYCLVDNGASVTAWDIDDLEINVSCQEILGGTIEGGPFEFCVGDGAADMLSPGDITLSGNTGTNSAWVVTDIDGNILGLPPMPSDVDFDGAGSGTCLIWHLSYEDGLMGATMGENAADLEGCFSLSNSIEVIRTIADGGTIEGGPFEFCVGDGVSDMLSPGDISLSGNSGTNSAWVVTDIDGNILALPPMPSDVDFDGAGSGTCLIWHLSYEDGLTGAEMGMNASDLEGCFSLSNPIEVVRNQPSGGTIEGGPFVFCVGDGVADMLSPGDITLSGNSGTNSAWVVTDIDGNILGLPPMPSDVDFDGAEIGTCLIWHLSYEDGLEGAEMGMNASDLEGCFSLSNSIEVIRTIADGGTIEGGPFEFCVGDGVSDMLSPGDITLTGNNGANSAWVVTDIDGNILGLPPMPSDVDFDGAGEGTCLIWHLSYADGLTGAEMGMNAGDLQGCFSLSNPIEVVRNQPEGGVLEGGPFAFCVGDDVEDFITDDELFLSENSGANSAWVITDIDGNILGLPPTPFDVNFDEAGAGTCLIWHLSYADGLTGAEMGMNAGDLQGCFSLSNPIEVVRSQPVGGILEGGPFEFCVGDSVADMLSPGDITLSGNSGSNSVWVVTDSDGNILGLPLMPSVIDFDGAREGTCLIWHLSYEDGIEGAGLGLNAADLEGCFSLSNPIEVIRNHVEGGTLIGSDFEFCVGDGQDDFVRNITLLNAAGENQQWIVTDENGSILGLPGSPSDVNFDQAPAGVCFIWNISYSGTVEGLEMGANASELMGCYDLSNSVSVIRREAGDCADNCLAYGGTIVGGAFEFCVGDGIADHVSNISLLANGGTNSQWIVTDDLGNVLGLPGEIEDVDFDDAPSGICYIWHMSYEFVDGLDAVENLSDLEGCFALSNAIAVVRNSEEDCQNSCEANGGLLSGDNFEFCVGDGEDDFIPAGSITLSGNSATNNAWVITDVQGNILGLPPMPSAVNFEEAGPGVCLIWNISFEDDLEGAEMGMNVLNLTGCYNLSNYITVVRNENGVDCNMIEEQNNFVQSTVTVYPNPVVDEVNVKLENFNEGAIQIELYDIIGNQVHFENRTVQVDDIFRMDVSTLNQGVYTLRIIQNNRIKSKNRIVVTNR